MTDYRPPPVGAACPEPACSGVVRLHVDYGDTSASYECSAHPWGSADPHIWYKPHDDKKPREGKVAKRARTMTGAPARSAGKRTITRVRGVMRHGAFDIEVGPKTLILGPPSRGKTTICNAITLALAGYADDVAGHDDERKGADLYRHLVAPGADAVEAEVVLSDGATFTYHKVDGREAEGVHLPAEATPFVLPDFARILGASAPTQRKWLAQVCSRYVDDATLEATRVSLALGDFAWSPAEAKLPPLDRLDAFADRTDGEKRRADDLARTERRVIDAETVGAGLPVTDSTVAAYQEAYDRAVASGATGVSPEEHRAAVDAASSWIPVVSARQAEHAAAVAAYNDAAQTVVAWEQYVERFPAPPVVDDATRAWAETRLADLTAIERTATLGRNGYTGCCPICTAPMQEAHFRTVTDTTLRMVDAERAQVQAVLSPVDPHAADRQNLESWREEKRLREVAAAEAHADLVEAENALAAWQERASLPVAGTPSGDVGQARAALTDLLRRREAHARIARARAALRDAEAAASTAKALKDNAVTLRDALTKGAIATFEEAVSRYLPANEKFHVEYGTSWVRFGLVRDGVFRSATAGTETARMLAAVAACVSADRDLAVIIVPERQYDPATLTLTMRALTDAPAQVFLVSTVRWEGKLPAGWTVVDLTAPPGGEKVAPTETAEATEDHVQNGARLVAMTAVAPAHPPVVDPGALLAAAVAAPVTPIDVGPMIEPGSPEDAEIRDIVGGASVLAPSVADEVAAVEAERGAAPWWVFGVADRADRPAHDLPVAGLPTVKRSAKREIAVDGIWSLHEDGSVIRYDPDVPYYRYWSRVWVGDPRLDALAKAADAGDKVRPWGPTAPRWLATLDPSKATVDVEDLDPTPYLVKLGAPEAAWRHPDGRYEALLYASGAVVWTDRVGRMLQW